MSKQPNDAAAADGSPLSSDLLWGIKAVAMELGQSERQAFHLIQSGRIPTGKVGGRIVASRSALRRHFEAALNGGDA